MGTVKIERCLLKGEWSVGQLLVLPMHTVLRSCVGNPWDARFAPYDTAVCVRALMETAPLTEGLVTLLPRVSLNRLILERGWLAIC
jgi:hypothetical protein